jgi:replicative DNA helicase
MRNQEVAERFLALMTGIPITNIRLGILNQSQVNQIYEALKEFKTLPIYIDTSFRSSDLYYIESTVNRYKRLYDIKVIYLDYIQILVDRDDNQTHELGRVSRLFKTMANELDITSVVLSQLNRGVESRDNKRPVLSDLRQSGNLEEDADIVVGLYRDDYYNKETKFKGLMEYIVLKYRNGPVGTVTLKFEDSTNIITGA